MIKEKQDKLFEEWKKNRPGFVSDEGSQWWCKLGFV